MINPFPKFRELRAAMAKLTEFMEQHRNPGTSGLPAEVEFALRSAVTLTADLQSMLDARTEKLRPLTTRLGRNKEFAKNDPRKAADETEVAFAILQVVDEAGEALNFTGIRRGMRAKATRLRRGGYYLEVLRDAGLLVRPEGNNKALAPHNLTDEARQLLVQLKAALDE